MSSSITTTARLSCSECRTSVTADIKITCRVENTTDEPDIVPDIHPTFVCITCESPLLVEPIEKVNA
jgi:hypothetical protein